MTLRESQQRAGAVFMGFGPEDAGGAGGTGGVSIAQDFSAYEAEYAAIRKRVGILHQPQRGIVSLTGGDVKDFLHRLLTQNINAMAGGQSRRAFLLNEKGRIVSDMIVHHGDQSTWLEMDRFDIPAVIASLEARLFTEDVLIADWSDKRVALALHGPAAGALLAKVAQQDVAACVESPGTHHVLTLAGVACTVSRRDQCGVPGLHVFVPTPPDAPDAEAPRKVYEALLMASGFEVDAPDPTDDPQGAAQAMARRRETLRGRPIGWLAFNTARIEAATPLFHIDFTTDCVPAETGLLDVAVSFTKGCYLGQEIVARMKSLGHPKRLLVALTLPDDRLPTAGTVVSSTGDKVAEVGMVTSSAVSPILGRAVALAMVKWAWHTPGTKLTVPAEGARVEVVAASMQSSIA